MTGASETAAEETAAGNEIFRTEEKTTFFRLWALAKPETGDYKPPIRRRAKLFEGRKGV